MIEVLQLLCVKGESSPLSADRKRGKMIVERDGGNTHSVKDVAIVMSRLS